MVKWEYLALNLKKVPGMSTEDQFNKRGAEGVFDDLSTTNGSIWRFAPPRRARRSEPGVSAVG
jgi:hypothetical protein